MRRTGIRPSRGVTLVELTISMGIATLLSMQFFSVMNQVTSMYAYQKRATFYSSEVRSVVHQIARDLRASGSNPLSKPFLFDGNPTTDMPLVLDPLNTGQPAGAIMVKFDKYGSSDGNGPDGDADDDREAIRYRYDASNHQLFREYKVGTGWSSELFLVNVCSFAFTYYDTKLQQTVDPWKVSWVYLNTVTTTAPHNCYERGEITRLWSLHIKLRNR